MNLKCVISSSYVQDCQIVRCLLSFVYMTRGDKSPTLPPTIMEVEILVKETNFEVSHFPLPLLSNGFFGGKKRQRLTVRKSNSSISKMG